MPTGTSGSIKAVEVRKRTKAFKVLENLSSTRDGEDEEDNRSVVMRSINLQQRLDGHES